MSLSKAMRALWSASASSKQTGNGSGFVGMHQAFQAWIPALSQRTSVCGHSHPAWRKPRKPSPCSRNVGSAWIQHRGSTNSDNISITAIWSPHYWTLLKSPRGLGEQLHFYGMLCPSYIGSYTGLLPVKIHKLAPSLPLHRHIALWQSECSRRYRLSKSYSLS